MRVFMHYEFFVGTKIPFKDWPDIVNHFLEASSLGYQGLDYYFGCLDMTDDYQAVLDGTKCKTCTAFTRCKYCKTEAESYLKKGNACQRAAKEHPKLGPIHYAPHPRFKTAFLTSIGNSDGCGETQLLPMLNTLSRRYGFSDSYLIYRDVNFFGQISPAIVNKEHPTVEQVLGSQIVLHRGAAFESHWNSISLQIDITGGAADPSAYRDTMADLLPGVRHWSYTQVRPTPEETAQYAHRHQAAAPLIKQAEEKLKNVLQCSSEPSPGKAISVSALLKKLAKEFGYTYQKPGAGMYSLSKRDSLGHFIRLEIDTGRCGNELNPLLQYAGLAFCHTIGGIPIDTTTPGATVHGLRQFLLAVQELQESLLPQIGALYPETPLWFTNINT